MNKRWMALGLAAAMCLGSTAVHAQEEKKLSVVTTIFPIYDWVHEVAGDAADITMLLDKGTDLHSYEPTAQDLIRLSTADVFLYIGGESDDWVEGALKNTANPDMKVLNLMDLLGEDIKEEELAEGMQAEEEEEAEEEEGPEYDEHIWLSLRNAGKLCTVIAEALEDADEAHADLYAQNALDYLAKLSELDEAYANVCEAASLKTLLFGDRFPFRYLTDDYGLEYYAAFAGCSAESEASFETIAYLADRLNELKLPAVLALEESDGKIAQTIIDTSDQKEAQILRLNSMQSITGMDVEEGISYLELCEQNLEVLKKALQEE